MWGVRRFTNIRCGVFGDEVPHLKCAVGEGCSQQGNVLLAFVGSKLGAWEWAWVVEVGWAGNKVGIVVGMVKEKEGDNKDSRVVGQQNMEIGIVEAKRSMVVVIVGGKCCDLSLGSWSDGSDVRLKE
jgi:hypothetical protein